MCSPLPFKFGPRLCYSILFVLILGLTNRFSYAEQPLSFVPAGTTCTSIFLTLRQWEKYPPALPDSQKTPIFTGNGDAQATEWKQLYLPQRELAQQEIVSINPSYQKGGSTTSGSSTTEPGLLVNSQPWIDFLRPCPNRISSNRQMNPNRKPDWVAPHFFELYELPLKQGSQKIIATRFQDHSPYFGGDYLVLYSADNCSAEKLFVSQGTNQQLEFLHRNGKLVVSVKSPDAGSQSFFTATEKPSDEDNFVEICRAILRK